MKIILIIGFLIGAAFLTDHFLISKMNQSDREVAAFGERNTDQQIKWEQNIANELSKNKENVQVSVKPNWQDQMMYDFLKGQYDVKIKDGQLEKLTLQSSQEGVNFAVQDFIQKFGSQLKSYESYQISKNSSEQEVVNFFSKTGEKSGSLEIMRNNKGQVQEILIK